MAKLEPTHDNVLKDLGDDQSADTDNRSMVREADYFVNKRDGQWEPDIVQLFSGKPRYTIDRTSGIINDAHGEMSSMDFSLKVRPAGGPATTLLANHCAGLLRNIENNSGNGAKYIYRAAGKKMLTGGLGGWGVKQGYRSGRSFDQDLIIYPISNFEDRIWFDASAELPDASDAERGWKLTSMPLSKYNHKFPKGSKLSVGRDKEGSVYAYKNQNAVVIGEQYWKKYKRSTLVRMTNGQIFEVDEKFLAVKDELADKGVTVEAERETSIATVYHRLFDGGDFLSDATKTVFTYVPLVPVYGNFEISDDKLIYYGLVEKHMDPQRILNYVESRKVEEGALAPRRKIWATDEQIADHTETIATLNTNTDPVQRWNHIPDVPQPFETGGAQINPGLSETSNDMINHMKSISGRLDPSGDTALGLQSGVALQTLQNKGDTGNVAYFTAMEEAIAHTCRICIDAIPRVYDARREIQLDDQDGTSNTITINERIYDDESGKIIEINDLSKGSYSVTCSSGPAFHNRQQETVTAIETIAKIDPSILETGRDIYLANIPSPGMDKLAARARAMMIKQGVIPEEELTEEEKQKLANTPPPEPSAMDKALIAEAEATTKDTEAKTADTMSKIEERQVKVELEIAKLELASKKQADENKLDTNKLILESMQAQDSQIKIMAESLKLIREAIGAEAAIMPQAEEAFKNQADMLNSAVKASE